MIQSIYTFSVKPLSEDFNVDLRRLHVLRAFAEHETVTATAQALHLTPSAVSQQLAGLSREAGVPILAKFGRRVQLTPQARILLTHAERVREQLELAYSDLQQHEAGKAGRLVVGSFGSAVPRLITPALHCLLDHAPDVEAVVVETEPPECYARLSSGDIDVAVAVDWRGAPTTSDPRFSQQFVLEDPFDLLLPAGHPAADGTAIDLPDLHSAAWVMGVSGPCFEVSMSACKAAGFTPDIRHQVGDWNAQMALVAAGLGVALIPRLSLAGVPANAVLRPVRQRPVRRVVLVTRRGAADSPVQAAFRGALDQVAR